jgi:hypothetical protein
MSTLRPFQATDLFKFNHINLDPLTETYNIPFYLTYLSSWPSLCATYEDPSGRLARVLFLTVLFKNHIQINHIYFVSTHCVFTCMAAYRLMGYILGKAEGADELWHGHVTCVTGTDPIQYSTRTIGVFMQLTLFYFFCIISFAGVSQAWRCKESHELLRDDNA